MLPYNHLVQLISAMNWVVLTTGQLYYGISRLVLEELGKPGARGFLFTSVAIQISSFSWVL